MSKRTDRSLGSKQYTGYGTNMPYIVPSKQRARRRGLFWDAVFTMVACLAIAGLVYFLLHT